MRSHIKLEMTAFDPVSPIEYRPLRSILDRALGRNPPEDTPMVPVVGLADAVADKVVGYLRRTASHRAG